MDKYPSKINILKNLNKEIGFLQFNSNVKGQSYLTLIAKILRVNLVVLMCLTSIKVI